METDILALVRHHAKHAYDACMVGSGQMALSSAVAAACRVASRFDCETSHPVVLQESNNTVVWLRPHAIIAKVGKWQHSNASLVREHAVGSALRKLGAPIAPPIPGPGPTRDPQTGYVVTLWTRLDNDPEAAAAPSDTARSLRELHTALMQYDGDLPGFEASLDLARNALYDDDRTRSAPPSDRSMLRAAFDRLRDDVRAREFTARPLHGEAHDRNVLVTPAGLRWIDFEGACLGPLEWDLAFLPKEAIEVFPEVDEDLLGLLRTLNSVRVATWCFVRWEFPEMRWHARFHLEQVRQAEQTRARSGDR